MNRRQARERLFTLVFEYSYKTEQDPAEVYANALVNGELENDGYRREQFTGISENLPDIDKLIEEHSSGWSLSRISKVSLAIMRVSVYEMTMRNDIPYTVSINEAVELAKKYDDDKSPKFINGILNAIAEEKGLKG